MFADFLKYTAGDCWRTKLYILPSIDKILSAFYKLGLRRFFNMLSEDCWGAKLYRPYDDSNNTI
jgi:hypothetical protein